MTAAVVVLSVAVLGLVLLLIGATRAANAWHKAFTDVQKQVLELAAEEIKADRDRRR